MAGTFSISGSQMTVAFSYTSGSARVVDTATYASKQLYNDDIIAQGIGSYDSLSSQEKLDIIDRFVKDSIVTLARKQFVQDVSQLARSQAKTELDSKFISEN